MFSLQQEIVDRPAPRQPHCSLLPAPRRALPIQCSSPSRWSRSARPCTRATRPCCGARPRGTPSRSFSGRARIASWTPPSWDPGRPSPPPHPAASPAAQAPGASQVGNAGASLPAGQVQPLGREDPLKKEMATHSSALAWEIPWIEEAGRLQSMGSQRVGQD